MFEQNAHMYKALLTRDIELGDVGRLHLYGLRLIIDLKLGNEMDVYLDYKEICDIIYGDEYLSKEWATRYQINHAELTHDYLYN